MNKILTKEIAEQFLGDPDGVELDEFTSIEDEAAESLSKLQGWLSLNSLTELSDAAAESLSKHKGRLNLKGMTKLSDAAAESLSKHKEHLIINSLVELSNAAVESLSKHGSAEKVAESTICLGDRFDGVIIGIETYNDKYKIITDWLLKNNVSFVWSTWNASGDDGFFETTIYDSSGGKLDYDTDIDSFIQVIIDRNGCEYDGNNNGSTGAFLWDVVNKKATWQGEFTTEHSDLQTFLWACRCHGIIYLSCKMKYNLSDADLSTINKRDEAQEEFAKVYDKLKVLTADDSNYSELKKRYDEIDSEIDILNNEIDDLELEYDDCLDISQEKWELNDDLDISHKSLAFGGFILKFFKNKFIDSNNSNRAIKSPLKGFSYPFFEPNFEKRIFSVFKDLITDSIILWRQSADECSDEIMNMLISGCNTKADIINKNLIMENKNQIVKIEVPEDLFEIKNIKI